MGARPEARQARGCTSSSACTHTHPSHTLCPPLTHSSHTLTHALTHALTHTHSHTLTHTHTHTLTDTHTLTHTTLTHPFTSPPQAQLRFLELDTDRDGLLSVQAPKLVLKSVGVFHGSPSKLRARTDLLAQVYGRLLTN